MSRSTIIDEILRNHMLVKTIGEQSELFQRSNPKIRRWDELKKMAVFSHPFFLSFFVITFAWIPYIGARLILLCANQVVML